MAYFDFWLIYSLYWNCYKVDTISYIIGPTIDVGHKIINKISNQEKWNIIDIY
jgi:hypothetical protein